MRPNPFRVALVAVAVASLAPIASEAGRPRPPSTHESVGFQNFQSPQANPIALSPDGSKLYVANTTSGTVSVISTGTSSVIATVNVGVEPVSVAVRPDGLEVWVSNHVSDSVSVIDTNPASPTFHRVKETIQEFDAAGATLFDEPVGIAFASNAKAY
ncbi:MAG TPA: YncE family protein, partial [Myxococcota bacterium]|nr:YncE family protein [Myxococcota bacterium]